ncbi:MAG: 1,4-dihydroxy-6-naphthoate synthase [Bacteroidota bacterium]
MNKHHYSLGFSPCPNDTYIFAALVNGWIDTQRLTFKAVLADVEHLNQHALKAEFDITKLSFGVLPHVMNSYCILQSGSAIGNACGPLIISKHPATIEQLSEMRLGIPGKMTSAYVFYRMFAPQPKEIKEMLFSDIEDALFHNEIDAGLIIHENRFTYQQKGLLKIADVGSLWEDKFHLPVPLGAITAKNDIPPNELKTIDSLIKQSIEYANSHPLQVMEYVRKYAQELDEKVMKQHIELYVNENSLVRSPEAEQAILVFIQQALALGIRKDLDESIINKK